VAINDTSFFKVTGQLRGRQYIHTLHFRHLSVPVGGANPDQVLIDAWQTVAQAAWLQAHTSDYSMQTISAQRICGSPPLPSPTLEASGLTGTRSPASGDPLSPWLCLRANEGTGLAGRSRHGAFFFSGGWELDVNQDVPDPTAGRWLPLAQSYCTALMTGFGPSGSNSDFRLVVHSRKLASVPGTQCDQASTQVTSLVVTPRLTTNRSRRQ